MPTRIPDPGRRRMLGALRNATVAAAGAAVLGPAGPARAAPVPQRAGPPEHGTGRGYRDSEHTRRYYALARY